MDLWAHANRLQSVKESIKELADIVNAQKKYGIELLHARQRLVEFEQMLEIDYESHVATVSGRIVKLYKCTPDDIVTSDIVWSLCGQNRFLNHTQKPYSVGKHLIYGCYLAEERGWSGAAVKAWLLHDAEEAYVGDLAAPVKKAGSNLAHELASEHISKQIAKRYGVTYEPYRIQVKNLDILCRDHENNWRLGKGATDKLLEVVSLSDVAAHHILTSLYHVYVEKS